MRPIFCGNFEYDARQSDLERLFRKYGRVERVDMKSVIDNFMYESEVTKDELPLCRSRSSLCRNFGCVGSFLLVTTQTGLYILVWMLTELPSNSDMFQGRNIADLMAEAAEKMEKAH
ncbi:RNA recognition motif domain - like 10 [Theobroma cacao]|nr:RNA recognition motif domain - like 10 [Theobroma cacao]